MMLVLSLLYAVFVGAHPHYYDDDNVDDTHDIDDHLLWLIIGNPTQ